ncbi:MULTISPECIES: hypothetical protein [unclassified Haloferax]|uniref:hypothetical protein n=1 Tax=unclassified Haloferax TaxID=2625095 RepID=UPI0028754489|nr:MULTISPECIES: hypothetical protein [unclassified Haloferax]MDS0243067.1 hypothetical protein [Haloferax sp. S2CR25]MDS0446188.1 hypothetical protein [Haloferax sp. S2CR25-2]
MYHSQVSQDIRHPSSGTAVVVNRHSDGSRFESVDAMIRHLVAMGDTEIVEFLEAAL